MGDNLICGLNRMPKASVPCDRPPTQVGCPVWSWPDERMGRKPSCATDRSRLGASAIRRFNLYHHYRHPAVFIVGKTGTRRDRVDHGEELLQWLSPRWGCPGAGHQRYRFVSIVQFNRVGRFDGQGRREAAQRRHHANFRHTMSPHLHRSSHLPRRSPYGVGVRDVAVSWERYSPRSIPRRWRCLQFDSVRERIRRAGKDAGGIVLYVGAITERRSP